MRIFSLGFLFGVCVIFLFSSLPNLILLGFLFLISFLFYLKYKLDLRWREDNGLFFILALFSGMLWVEIRAQFFMAKPISHVLENKPIKIIGVIQDLPKQEPHYCGFYFSPLQPVFQEKWARKKIKVSWYADCPTIKPNQVWQLVLKLKQPHGLSNPGGFNFETWAIENHLIATGSVVIGSQNKLIKERYHHFSMDRLRYHLLILQNQALPPIKGADFISALTIGDRSRIDTDDWIILQNTGTNHLVAIAGLHIGLITGLVFFLVRRGWSKFFRLSLLCSAQQAAAVLSLIFALIYAGLAGFSLPTQRAVVMLSILFFALIIKRRVAPWYGYSLAIFCIVFFDPFVILSMSFWLSFSAVAVIIYTVTGSLSSKKKWLETAKMQLAVSLGVLPCTILFFQKASIISPIVNALVIPLVGFLVIPLGLLGTGFLFINHHVAVMLFYLSAYCMQGVWWFLSYMAAWPYGEVNFAFPDNLALVCFCLSLALLFLPKGFPFKYLSIFLFFPIFFIKKNLPPEGGLYFTMLDVGQGLSTVIETHRHTMVFDAGPAMRKGFDAGKEVVMPYLRKKGIDHLDLLMISHGDNDHAGGAWSIMKEFSVKHMMSSVPEKFPSAWKVTSCISGMAWQWDGVYFKVLSPDESELTGSKNDHSCVIKITAGEHSILLTGDIEKSTEKQLLMTQSLSADILQVPHHGSKTSSTEAFVAAVAPHFALFPTGYLNRYHFPIKSIVDRYEHAHAMMYNTAFSGAILFSILPHQEIAPPVQYRLSHVRWWNLGVKDGFITCNRINC